MHTPTQHKNIFAHQGKFLSPKEKNIDYSLSIEIMSTSGQKKDPVVVGIYKQDRAPPSCAHLKTISSRPPVTLNKHGKVAVRIKFTLKQLLMNQKDDFTVLQFRLRDVAIDQKELENLTPRGNINTPGYVVEMNGTGHSNDSPVTVLYGFPGLTRTSFSILKELSDKSPLPADIEARLESNAPLLTMMCSPSYDFHGDGFINRAMRLARERYGMHFYANTEDGSILSQNPKAMIIIDECIGVNKTSLENTFYKDSSDPKRRVIHTPGDSLISSVVRTYPPSAIRLVWDDQKGSAPFEVTNDVMFRIPESVGNHVVNYILRRAKIVSGLYVTLADTTLAIQASSMHGTWEYDEHTNVYTNKDTGCTYNADDEYEFVAQVNVSMRYVLPSESACAITTLGVSHFYPMPVWASSDIVNGKVRNSDAKPLLNLLHDSVAEKLSDAIDNPEGSRRKRTEAVLHASKTGEPTVAASSRPVEDD